MNWKFWQKKNGYRTETIRVKPKDGGVVEGKTFSLKGDGFQPWNWTLEIDGKRQDRVEEVNFNLKANSYALLEVTYVVA